MTPVTPSSVCDMQGALSFAPHFQECETPEPSLSGLIYRYYRAHFDDKAKADSLASRYIAALAERTQQEAQPVAWMYTAKEQNANPMVMRQPMSAGAMARDLWDEHPLYTRPTSAADCTAPMQPSAAVFEGLMRDFQKLKNRPDAANFHAFEGLLTIGLQDVLLAAPTQAPMQPSDVELDLMRSVYEQARKVLRFTGIDKPRAEMAWDELDRAIERVKEFDGGTMDLAAPTQAAPATEPPFVTAMIDARRERYALDQSCTPAFLHWLDTMTPREGVGANEAWNAGVEWQKTQAAPAATGFDAWWNVFFSIAGKDKAWPVKQAAREAFATLAAPTQAAPAAQSDLPPPDSAYWVNHDVTSPYTERAKPADTPYNLGWMSGWAAHGRAYPEQAAPAAQAGGELTDEQIDDLRAEANRGMNIDRDDYFKAFRDAEFIHGIGMIPAPAAAPAAQAGGEAEDEAEALERLASRPFPFPTPTLGYRFRTPVDEEGPQWAGVLSGWKVAATHPTDAVDITPLVAAAPAAAVEPWMEQEANYEKQMRECAAAEKGADHG